MRKLSLILAGAALALSANAFALVTITGDPVVVTETNGVYTFPTTTTTTYTSTSPYYYVAVGDSKKVCYRDVQPGLASVNVVGMTLRVGSDTVAVHCYDASPTYFQFSP